MQSGKRQPGGLLRAAQSDPKVGRKEACARWALATEGGKATRRCEQIQGLRAASAQNADICEGSEASGGGGWGKRCGWNEPRFLRPLAARNACEVVLRHRAWGAAPNPGRGVTPLHPTFLSSPAVTTIFQCLHP